MISCIVVFLALAMFNFFEFMQKRQELAEITADVNTLTPSDYTVYINLGPKCDIFNSFLNSKDERSQWYEEH
jgi:hypothetical protein